MIKQTFANIKWEKRFNSKRAKQIYAHYDGVNVVTVGPTGMVEIPRVDLPHLIEHIELWLETLKQIEY